MSEEWATGTRNKPAKRRRRSPEVIVVDMHSILDSLMRRRTDLRRRLLSGFLLVAAVSALGAIHAASHPLQTTTDEFEPMAFAVQLRHATLPMPLQPIAVHYWFVIFKPDKNIYRRRQRWELWQDADAGGTSWGHVYRNLMDVDAGVGGGPRVVDAEWHDDEARRIAAVLNAPEQYPYRGYYHAWPGPNSNTYAAWILRQAGVPFDFDARAIGKDFRGIIGGGVSGTERNSN